MFSERLKNGLYRCEYKKLDVFGQFIIFFYQNFRKNACDDRIDE